MLDGSVGWNPGKKNPKIVRPAGPTDPAVPVVLFETTDKTPKPIATYVNFAMHLDTVGGLYYSADYPFTLAQSARGGEGRRHGDGLHHRHLRRHQPHQRRTTPEPQKGDGEAARIGTRLAAEVLRTFDKLNRRPTARCACRARWWNWRCRAVTPEEVAAAKRVIADVQAGKKPAPKFLDQVQAFKAVDVAGRLGKPHSVEVQVISLGDDLAWVSLPGEIFVRARAADQGGSPFKQTMIAELANGSIGYIPNRVAYPQGNYEVVSARCAAGSGEKLVDEAIEQLRGQFGK